MAPAVAAAAPGFPAPPTQVNAIEEALPAEPNARAVSLLKAWEAEDATDDPAELEARRADWEATKADLDERHGSDRKLFP